MLRAELPSLALKAKPCQGPLGTAGHKREVGACNGSGNQGSKIMTDCGSETRIYSSSCMVMVVLLRHRGVLG